MFSIFFQYALVPQRLEGGSRSRGRISQRKESLVEVLDKKGTRSFTVKGNFDINV